MSRADAGPGAARARLAAAAPALRERPQQQLIDAIAGCLELWRDPDSQYRREILERHPATSGLGHACVAAGLELGLGAWSGAALRELFARELAPALEGGARLAPFALTSVLLAGSIPMPSLLHCLLPLLLRSPALVRTASRDPVTAPLVARSLRELDPELGRCIEVVSFPSGDESALDEFLAADCIVASGSDETLAAVAARLAPGQRWVGYGHRLSIALLGPEAVQSREHSARIARALSIDVALWDQLGCLSPVSVFVMEPEAERRAAGVALLAELLAGALAEREREWPRGALATAEAAAIRHERDEAELRAAAGGRVEVHGDPQLRFSVVAEADARWRPAPLHRFVRVQPLAGFEDLDVAIRPFAHQLAAVALDGFAQSGPWSQERATHALLALGASRLCRPGSLQAPPLGWHHDGAAVLLPLARFLDVEID